MVVTVSSEALPPALISVFCFVLVRTGEVSESRVRMFSPATNRAEAMSSLWVYADKARYKTRVNIGLALTHFLGYVVELVCLLLVCVKHRMRVFLFSDMLCP